MLGLIKPNGTVFTSVRLIWKYNLISFSLTGNTIKILFHSQTFPFLTMEMNHYGRKCAQTEILYEIC